MARQQATGDAPLPPPGLSAVDRIEELDAGQPEREAAGVRHLQYANTTDLARKYGLEAWFRLMSGQAHQKEWALGAVTSREPSPMPSSEAAIHFRSRAPPARPSPR